jgi:hypothetical protein
MDALIYPRTGMTPDELAALEGSSPLTQPRLWLSRAEAAHVLKVNIRSVDRYVRNGELTYYGGPVEGAAYGVAVLLADVRRKQELTVTVVVPDGE